MEEAAGGAVPGCELIRKPATDFGVALFRLAHKPHGLDVAFEVVGMSGDEEEVIGHDDAAYLYGRWFGPVPFQARAG